MQRFPKRIILIILLVVAISSCKQAERPPNIIYILADDLGYGDLGCYGQKLFETPNIDRLATEGMTFTQHYSGSTVCAPSRSALMTGQHTGHTPIRGNKGVDPEGQYPLKSEAYTLAELLNEAGYATGAFGKWGLGPPGSEGDPLAQGFDEFFGYNCQSLAHNYYPRHLWHNDQKIILEGNRDTLEGTYAPFLIQEHALGFIEEHAARPFFCYVPGVIPHAELAAPEAYMNKYRGRYLPEKVYQGCDPGCKRYKEGGYGSQPESHAAFVAMIDILDEQVGQIIKKVDELGLKENTLIVFTSDNGPHLEGGADPDYFDSNGPLRGYKRDIFEGGIRVPMLARWPGTIDPGHTSEHVSAFWDVLPTFADLLGKSLPVPVDGISFLPTLTGKGKQQEHEYLYWEFYERGGRRGIRKGNWKAVEYDLLAEPSSPVMLFDLSEDVGEQNDLAAGHPDLVRELVRLMDRAHKESGVFEIR